MNVSFSITNGAIDGPGISHSTGRFAPSLGLKSHIALKNFCLLITVLGCFFFGNLQGLGFGGSSGGPPLSFSTSFSGYGYDTHRLRPQLSSESHIRARYLRIERHYEERRLREGGVEKKQKKRSLKIGKKGVRIRREGEEEEEEEEEKQPEFLELASEKKSNERTRLSPKVLTRNVLVSKHVFSRISLVLLMILALDDCL